jgi:hypothetical protein
MPRRHAGFVLITALSVAVSSIALTAVGLTRSLQEISTAERSVKLQQALHLADAGVDAALSELIRGGEDGEATFSSDEGWADAEDQACAAGTPCLHTVDLLTGSAFVTLDDIDADPIVITVTGTASGVSQAVELIVDNPNSSLFQQAIFGEQGIELDRDITIDSYDSSLGAYTPPPDTDNRSSDGDLRTNSTASNTVGLDQGVQVAWDVIVGSGGIPSAVIREDSPPQVTGTKEAASSNLTLPPIDVPDGTPCGGVLNVQPGQTLTVDVSGFCYSRISVGGNDNNGPGKLILTGSGQITLADSGTNQSLNVGAQATLELTGSVTLVGESVNVANALIIDGGGALELYATTSVFLKNAVNVGQTPSSFSINYSGTAPLVAGQATSFYGTIYAPNAAIELHQSGDFYGAVIGRSVSMDQGGKFHFDTSLRDGAGDGGSSEVTIRSWRQL